MFFRMLLLIVYLSGCQSATRLSHQSPPEQSVTGEQRILENDKLSEETEDLKGYNIQCHEEIHEQQGQYDLKCRIADKIGQKAMVESFWDLVFNPSVEQPEFNQIKLQNDSEWHIRFQLRLASSVSLGQFRSLTMVRATVEGLDEVQETSIDQAIGNYQSFLESSEQNQRDNLNSVLDNREYIEIVDGGLLFTMSYDEQMPNVRIFVRRDGIQDFAQDMPAISSEDSRFRYQIFYPCTSGERIEVRFYGANQNGIQSFTPGPTESSWFPVYIVP